MDRLLNTLYESLVGRCLMPAYETGLRRRGTFRYRREFASDQWKSPEELAQLQWQRLTALLWHAYETVPFYRAAFQSAGLTPEDIRSPSDFARLPLLDKQAVRQHRDRLISSAFDERDLIRSATGGSTGEPMRFCYDRASYERRTAAAMRGDEWAGWRLCAPEFYVWGVSLLPQTGMIKLKKRLYHAGLRRTIVNSFDLSAERIADHVRLYHRSSARVVIGYANALYLFALLAKDAGLKLKPPRGVISSAEKLFPHQRALIEEVFGAPVFDRYGCREVMMIGAECDRHTGLHVTSDNLYVEVVRNGQLCEPGELGDIVLTDLHNFGMPLIRYKVGDAGSWKGRDCPCGRGLPLLNVVEGRTLDLISTPSGKLVSGEFFPHLLKDFQEIRAYQIVQEQRDEIIMRLAVHRPIPEAQMDVLRKTVGDAVGPEVRVRWEIGPDLEIEQGTKFRPVVSRVPVELAGQIGK